MIWAIKGTLTDAALVIGDEVSTLMIIVWSYKSLNSTLLLSALHLVIDLLELLGHHGFHLTDLFLHLVLLSLFQVEETLTHLYTLEVDSAVIP